jgi:hypothetical protein
MDPHIRTLIEDSVDGLNTPEQDAELQVLLAQQAEARQYYEFLKQVPAGFKRLAHHYPTIDVADAVVSKITSSASSPQQLARIHPMPLKISPLHIIVAASILFAVAFGSYYAGTQSNAAQSEETFGTMGDGVQKAKRYRQSPIKDKDVILENQQYQKVFQSDQFMKLVKSGQLTQLAALPEFQAVIFNSAIVQLFSTPGLADLAMQPGFGDMVSQLNFTAMYTNEFQQMTQDLNFVAAFSNPELKAFLNSPEVQGLQNVAQLNALQFNNPSFQQLSNNFQALMKNPEYNAVIFNNAGFSDVLQSLATIQNLNYNCCLNRQTDWPFLNPEAVQLMANPELQAMMKNADFVQLMNAPEFSQLMNNADFQLMMSSPGFVDLLNNPAVLGKFITPY